MKRFIYNHLKDWKLSSNRKPLIMYGARQVGKTYIIKEFGDNEFENMVYINSSLKFEITAKRLYAASQRVL